jgi:hypothetical protein
MKLIQWITRISKAFYTRLVMHRFNFIINRARKKYRENRILYDKLDRLFFKYAPETEIDKFWSAPVYDRPNVIIGKTKKQMDKEWSAIIS